MPLEISTFCSPWASLQRRVSQPQEDIFGFHCSGVGHSHSHTNVPPSLYIGRPSHTWGDSWPVISHARLLQHLEWMGQNAARTSDRTCGPMWRRPTSLTYHLSFLDKYPPRISTIRQCFLILWYELLASTLERQSHFNE